jgi:hypothetical protein
MSDEEKIQEQKQEEQFEGLINIVPKMIKGEYKPQQTTQTDEGSGIRGFILAIGDNMMNATIIISIIALVIITLRVLFTLGFLQGILVLLLGLIIITLLSYTILCIIDARYNLRKIADNTTKLVEIKKEKDN